MSQPKLSDLVQQSRSDKAKERRRAYQQMAASGDPQIIPYLRQAYLNDDDDKVRDIAFDALAAFKAIQQGYTSRRLPGGSVLKKLAGFLTLTLIISLALHAAMRLGSNSTNTEGTRLAQNTVTNRDTLVTLMQDRIIEANAFSVMLRSEIARYTEAGEVACNLDQPQPQPILMAEIDHLTYRDLSVVANKLDAAIAALDSAQFQWRHSCRLPAPDVSDVLGASAALDQADIQLENVATVLQRAIDDPAPTAEPTHTPDPMAVNVPAPTSSAPTSTSAAPMPPTATPTATSAPGLTVTLPYPALDYAAILSGLSRQLSVIGDLQNTFGSGMLDQWRKAQTTSGLSSTSGCILDPWPAEFSLTPDQQMQLNRTDAADPELVTAIALVQEGMAAARQARALFERDCPTGALANSATEAIPLAEGAYNRLITARNLIDAIRQRPDTQ